MPTPIANNPKSTASIARHLLHPMLIPFPIAFFVFAFLCGLAFWRTGDAFWARAARQRSDLSSLATEEILQELLSNFSGIALFLLLLRDFSGGRRAIVSSGRCLGVGLDLRGSWHGLLRCWGRRWCRRCLGLNCGWLVLIQKPAEPFNERVFVDLAVLNDFWKSARLVQLIHTRQLYDSITELPELLVGGGGVLENALDVG